MSVKDIQPILDYLNRHQVRATYSAVGKVIGVPAIGVARYLGSPRPEASWIVSAATGSPSGYKPSERHSALYDQPQVIRSGKELIDLLGGIPPQSIESSNPSPPRKVVRKKEPVTTIVRLPTASQNVQLAGIDLAWMSDKNGSGIAIGYITEIGLTLQQLHCGVIGLDNVKSIIESARKLRGVAVDAPLIIENQEGNRPCEQSLNTVYSAKWAGCYPSNLSRFPDAFSVNLARWMQSNGFQHLGGKDNSPWQIECYPHPAIIELFGLSRRLKYKKGTLKEKQLGQAELADYISTLKGNQNLPIIIPDEFSSFFDTDTIGRLSGLALKHNEDALDSVICLYIAGLYAIGKEMTVFGNTKTGYIVVPNTA
jgi:predicted RNase H-like nuclease